ncbi:MAG: VTT domain-containing protein [Chloroflexi bacterium]|nr:VTT domain-containing protein [Chloroflexota bacterium]
MKTGRVFLLCLAAGVGVLLLVQYGQPLLDVLSDATALRRWVRSFGPLAPLVLFALQVLQIVIAPISAQAIGMAAGYLYGFWGGLAITFVGGVAGSVCALLLGRFLGRPLVARFADGRLIAWISRFDRVRSVIIWAILFALPIGDPLLYAAGLTGVSLRTLTLGAVIGRLPGMAFATYFGAGTEVIGWWAWVFGLTIGGISTALFSLYHRQAQHATERLVRWLGHEIRPEPASPEQELA